MKCLDLNPYCCSVNKICTVATRALHKRNIAIKTYLTSVAQW